MPPEENTRGEGRTHNSVTRNSRHELTRRRVVWDERMVRMKMAKSLFRLLENVHKPLEHGRDTFIPPVRYNTCNACTQLSLKRHTRRRQPD